MRLVLAMMLLGMASAAVAEDAEHRADRLRTEQLNRDAGAAAARRDQRSKAFHDRARSDYAAARKRYEQAMADWRRRVAACRAGDYSACDER